MASRKQRQRLRDAVMKANSGPLKGPSIRPAEQCGFCEDGLRDPYDERSVCPYCNGSGVRA